MNNTPIRTLLVTAMLALPLAAFAEGDSPWLPIPGDFALSLNHSEQSAKNAYIGGTQFPVSAITMGGASKYQRSSTALRLGYGLSDAVSLDATLTYGKTRVGGADNDQGRGDSVFGANWRVLDEFEQAGSPTVTLHAAAILKGSYDGARLAALGKDANGYELAVIVGKQVTSSLALWAELGLQDRSNGVPNASTVEVGARLRLAPMWSLSLGYSDKKFGGGLDIGGTGFSPARFQQVKEERGVAKLGVGFAFAPNQGLALNLAKVTRGRNTVKDDSIVGLAYTYAF